ncbi:MAG: transporter substrate-binding domain-containing protein [Desulfamplus sp.]|nr:transporter substrate-binding domain-containing protein [Desulfamplus sp.]
MPFNKKDPDAQYKTVTILYLICLIFISITSPCLGNNSKLQLTLEEKAWLSKNYTVNVRVGSAPPLIITDGRIQGIAIDYLTYIFNLNGIKFNYIQESEVTWPEALKYIEQHRIVDMVPTAKITDERKKHMLFTDEYIFAPWVIFTRSDADFVSSIEDLKGKTVSVEEGFVIHQKLKQDYPEINLKVASAKLEDYAEIPLRDLATGLVDAYIGNLIMTTYMIQRKGYTNVKVAAPTPFENHNQAMAIRNDWPELVSIINKSLAAMTQDQQTRILNKWLSIKYEYGIKKSDIIRWVLSIIGIASIFIGIVLLSNKRLTAEIYLRKAIEESLRKSEKKYRLLFENMMNGFALHEIVVDNQGKPVDYIFLEINSAFEHLTGLKHDNIIGRKVTEVLPGIEHDTSDWIGQYGKVALTGQELRFESYSKPVGRWFSVMAFSPEKNKFATIFLDITERKQVDLEKEKLISDLQNALKEVKQLSGLLPICSHCKKIRDDKGYWNQIEVYIRDHSDAEFSHGICQECAKKHYPDLNIYDD